MKDVPCNVLSTIDSRYEGYNCTNAIRCVDADGLVHYYTELENNKRTIILQSDTEGNTQVFKNTKK
jgi:hypothetical protein